MLTDGPGDLCRVITLRETSAVNGALAVAEKTSISWCDATFNPWHGCVKVSDGCTNCYAERDAKRFAAGQVLWGVGSERRTFGDKHWKAPTDWAKRPFCECMSCGWRGPTSKAGVKNNAAGFDRDPGAMLTCPQCQEPTLKETRQRVFCASMGDWLDLDAPLDDFVRLLDTIRKTPELDWLLLSKRIGNWRKRLGEALNASDSVALREWIALWLNGDAPVNVVLMATVINQEEYDRDIGKLLRTPARRRGLSIEPMLGAIDMRMGGASLPDYADHRPLAPLSWVICGGESGPHARPVSPDWVRRLRDQCADAGVPFHLKQWGEWLPMLGQAEGVSVGRKTTTADGWVMGWAGKAAAGRLLDGVEHNGFPS
jgi:protein gp37